MSSKLSVRHLASILIRNLALVKVAAVSLQSWMTSMMGWLDHCKLFLMWSLFWPPRVKQRSCYNALLLTRCLWSSSQNTCDLKARITRKLKTVTALNSISKFASNSMKRQADITIETYSRFSISNAILLRLIVIISRIQSWPDLLIFREGPNSSNS